MRLTLVRHGETISNKKGTIQGQRHGKLSILGIKQAKKVGLCLKKEKFEFIYISDLKRAIDTAKEIIKFHPNAKVIYEPKIRERSVGEFEGKTWGIERETAEKLGIKQVNFRPKGGESIADFKKRIKAFLRTIKRKHNGKKVLLVTHGGPITAILLHLLKIPAKDYRKYMPKNTAVSVFEFKNIKGKSIPKLIKLNCDKHLK
ncbi:MAG: histidine phosphatase family protein [Candidatus Woesearchaeota archaeon]|jgi:broad specificity phosphatase PhoE